MNRFPNKLMPICFFGVLTLATLFIVAAAILFDLTLGTVWTFGALAGCTLVMTACASLLRRLTPTAAATEIELTAFEFSVQMPTSQLIVMQEEEEQGEIIPL